MRIKYYLLGTLCLTLLGCAGGATKEGMIYISTTPIKFADVLESEVTVDSVDGGQSTNPLWTSEISNEAFADALKATLEALNLLSENGRYQLRVKLEKVDQPSFGFDMTVTTVINYQLIDTQISQTIVNETIEAKHTATTDDAFAGVKRLRLANEGSARKNIAELINRLSKINIATGQVSLVFYQRP